MLNTKTTTGAFAEMPGRPATPDPRRVRYDATEVLVILFAVMVFASPLILEALRLLK